MEARTGGKDWSLELAESARAGYIEGEEAGGGGLPGLLNSCASGWVGGLSFTDMGLCTKIASIGVKKQCRVQLETRGYSANPGDVYVKLSSGLEI